MITALGAEKLGALQHVAEGWYPLEHRGFFWPAKGTSRRPTVLGVSDSTKWPSLSLFSDEELFVSVSLGALA